MRVLQGECFPIHDKYKGITTVNDKSLILWEGPSQLDGAPLVLIATGLKGSGNAKTGKGMIQTYILRADVEPTEAIRQGLDASICGNCPHRGHDGFKGRTCYVNVGQGPLSVYRAYKRGSYRKATEQELTGIFAGRGLRLGTYGDPAAIPLWVWKAVAKDTAFTTGYTHQWRTAEGGYSEFCMASCDAPMDYYAATAAGYRTFRVRLDGEDRLKGEAVCPASREAGYKLTCDACKACSGTSQGRTGMATAGMARPQRRGGIVITVHGTAGNVNAYNFNRAQYLPLARGLQP